MAEASLGVTVLGDADSAVPRLLEETVHAMNKWKQKRVKWDAKSTSQGCVTGSKASTSSIVTGKAMSSQ